MGDQYVEIQIRKKDKLRADIAGVLKSSGPPEPYQPAQGRKVLNELQKEKSIIMLRADKGKATIIIETEEYPDRKKLLSEKQHMKN